MARNKFAERTCMTSFMNHICQCKECRAVIVDLVQGVLEDAMDLNDDTPDDTEETIEYDEEENPSEDTQ